MHVRVVLTRVDLYREGGIRFNKPSKKELSSSPTNFSLIFHQLISQCSSPPSKLVLNPLGELITSLKRILPILDSIPFLFLSPSLSLRPCAYDRHCYVFRNYKIHGKADHLANICLMIGLALKLVVAKNMTVSLSTLSV